MKIAKRIRARARKLPWGANLDQAIALIQEGRFHELLEKTGQIVGKSAKKLGAAYSLPSAPRPAVPINSLAAKSVFQRIGDIGLTHFLGTSQKLIFDQPENPKVTLLVILYNKAELTLACLRSLLEIRDIRFELILIDNASNDSTRELLQRIEGAKVILNDNNVGFLLACNQGAKLAQGEHLLLLNNDTIVLPGSLAAAIHTLESSRSIGAVGARIINLDGRLQEAGSYFLRDGTCQGYGRGDENPSAPPYMFRRDVDFCSGAFLLTPLALYRRLGGFDEDYAPAYYEEADYCMRLWKEGLRIVYEPLASILHYEFASSADTPAKSIQWMQAHQKIFAAKHAAELAKLPTKSTSLSARIAPRSAKKRLLFIEDRVPHVFLGAGYPRSHEILRQMEAIGFDVTFYPTVTFEEPWPSVYADISATVEVMLGSGLRELPRFLSERRGYYDVIFISRPDNMRAFRAVRKKYPEWFANTRVIYDAEAFFCMRNHTYQQLVGDPWSPDRLEKELSSEADLAKDCAVVLSVSASEKALFENHGISQARVLGYARPALPGKTDFRARKDLLFVGSMHFHPSPNSDSLVWFAREIFPRVREALGADIRLRIVGINHTHEIHALASDSIELLGVVPDLATFFGDARIFIAPTRFAAGIPLKVQEAASHGLPVVTTDLVAAQLGWQNDRELLASPILDPQSFADHCIRLYRDEALWQRLREGALKKVREECSPDRFRRVLAETLIPIGGDAP